MSHHMPPVVIDDIDGAETHIQLAEQDDNLIRMMVLPYGLAFLDSGGARALARALDEFADESDCRQIEAIS